MRTVLIGAVESSRIALRTAAGAPGWEVAAVVTLPRELAARHSDYADLSGDARAAGARLIPAADCNAVEVVDAIRAAEPDCVLVIGWSQICRPNLLAAASGRFIGYHPAPLPRLRGRAAIPWTILLDEKITASTLFWLDGGVDTGALLAQQFFHVAHDETAASLYERHLTALAELLSESLDRLKAGDAARRPQDERFATWAAKRTPEDGLIDWARPVKDIWRLVRAVGRPYPGAFTHLGDERLVIWAAEPVSAERHLGLPGQVVIREANGFVVRCGDGGLLVTEWRRAGGTQALPPLHGRLGGRRS
jgi:methionyl-tRNA formyltransferase